MSTLSSHEMLVVFLGIAVLVGVARTLGEFVEKFGQPAVVGELLTGILLGPSIMGAVAPDLIGSLFPRTGPPATVLDGLAGLSVVLLLLLAGLEIELSYVFQQIRSALLTSLLGFVFPFTAGFAAAWLMPSMLVPADGIPRFVFALFFGTALAITGLPVIAKTLLDLNLFKSKIGLLVMTCAMILDVVGFALFSVVMGLAGDEGASYWHVVRIVGFTAAFVLLTLTLWRWALNHVIHWAHRRLKKPVGALGLVFALTLLSSSATEWIGIHAIFGAFLAGIAIGDSQHLSETARNSIKQIVMSFFAPLYFASLGLRIDFASHFDVPLVLTVMALGSMTKILGNGLGSYWSGLPLRQAAAVGFGLNAGGIMQIVFAILAFQKGVIQESLLVAFILMSVATSILSGPMMARLVGRPEPEPAGAPVPEFAEAHNAHPSPAGGLAPSGSISAAEPALPHERRGP